MKHHISYLYYFFLLMCLGLSSCSKQMSENQQKISKNSNLDGQSIVVVTGTSEDEYARNNLKKASILQTSNTSDLVLNVKTEKAKIGLINYNTVTMFMRKFSDLAVINDSLYGNPIGIAFSKQRTDLLEKFNVFLKHLKESGDYAAICHRWIKDFDHAKMPNISNSGKNGIIKFQTDGEKPPFSFMGDSNKLSGLDIEIAQRFAASVGMKLEISMSNFGGVIESVSLGNVDMAADCIFITPERAKKINFSEPYFICNACAFALKKNVEGYSGNGQTGNSNFISSIKNSFEQNFVDQQRYKIILRGLLCTLEITIFAVILGTILGTLICMMRMRKNKLCQRIANLYILLFRGIPQVVLLMLLFYVVFASTNMNGVTVSIIGFSFIFSAYVSEMFRSSIETISQGQQEAGWSMGFTNFQTFYYIILPLTIRRVLPIYKGEVVGLIKMTSIVGYITVQDLTKVSDMIRSATFDAFMPLILITIIYFFIIWIFSLLLDYVHFAYSPKKSRFLPPHFLEHKS